MREPTITQRDREIVDAYVEHGLNKARAARALGVPRQSVSRAVLKVERLQGGPIQGTEEAPTTPTSTQKAITPGQVSERGHGDRKDSVVYVEREPKSLDDALDQFEVDRDIWRVRTWEVGEWNGLAKIKVSAGTEVLKIVTLYKIKVTFERLPQVQALKAILGPILAEAKVKAPKWRVSITTPKEAAGLLSYNVPDLHLGKLAWAPETGGPSYDVKIACHEFREALEVLTTKAKRNRWKPSKILLPVGNDFLNSDRMIGGKAGATTKGTLQDEDGRWQRSFVEGFRLVREGIHAIASAFGVPVEVVIVPGNHDEERIFYVGHSLEIAFENHPTVQIDNRPVLRKYFTHDGVLIGLTHGDKEPLRELPLLMAGRYDLTAYATREWYLGHLHSKKETEFETQSDTGTVLARRFRSLSPADSWHAAKGYEMSARSAEALFYDAESRFDGSAVHFA